MQYSNSVLLLFNYHHIFSLILGLFCHPFLVAIVATISFSYWKVIFELSVLPAVKLPQYLQSHQCHSFCHLCHHHQLLECFLQTQSSS